MKTITNKTHRPLSVPLPRGKTLHLGPGRTGQINADDADHPAVKKLVESGDIEIGDGGHGALGAGGHQVGRGSFRGPIGGGGGRRSGDR